MQNNQISCSSCSGLCCTKIENFSVNAGKNNILKDINLHIHCGELTAIIGPNGAGKSTLLKALLGEYRYSGSITFHSEDDSLLSKPSIGYVPQNLFIDNDSPCTVSDFIYASISQFPVFAIKHTNKKNNIMEILGKIDAAHLLNHRLRDLSGGELQRVLLGLALIPIPNLLLLDEPVSGIDKNGLILFYDIISQIRKKYDLSVIMISHDFENVFKYADRVVLINKEMLSYGTPSAVFSSEAFAKTFNYSSIQDLTERSDV
jgi:zinc transport system ATP-binding protein